MNMVSSRHLRNLSTSTRAAIAAVWMLVLAVGFTPVATRADVSSFDVGLVPAQTVRHGYTLSFEVYSSDLGSSATFSMAVDPGPVGAISLDADTGVFEYTPDSADRRPFEITFTPFWRPGRLRESSA